MLSPDCFQKEKLVSGPSKTSPLEGFVTNYNESCISHDGIVSEAQWITFNGWEYRPNVIVLLKHSFDTVSGLPEFAQINKVFIHHGNPYFLLTILETLQFDSHYHSFEIIVKEPEAKIIIGFRDVVECEPL